MSGPQRTEVNLMHATIRAAAPADIGRGIRGTFVPDDGPGVNRSMGAGLAKLAVVLVAIAVARNVIGHGGRHGGESRMSRRRQMIADLHRQLHAEEAAEPEGPARA
jgi:hypothetical protein